MGFFEKLAERKAPIIIDLPLVLEDGKPCQIKARPLVYGELVNRVHKVGGIPVVGGQQGPDRDMREEEMANLNKYIEMQIIRCVLAIRVVESGESKWKNIELTSDVEIETPKDLPAEGDKPERTLLKITDFEYVSGSVLNLLAEKIIINHTNFGGVMGELGPHRFREGPDGGVAHEGDGLGEVATRGDAELKR